MEKLQGVIGMFLKSLWGSLARAQVPKNQLRQNLHRPNYDNPTSEDSAIKRVDPQDSLHPKPEALKTIDPATSRGLSACPAKLHLPSPPRRGRWGPRAAAPQHALLLLAASRV